MHLHAALITALTTILLAIATGLVGRARGKFGIQVPATTGHPDFERVFRAHMNTLEQAVAFLPVLWLATIYSNEAVAAYLGYAWIVGRLWYIAGYVSEAKKRSMGFLIASLCFVALLGMSLWGIGRALLAG
jgi:glutathione S-transferase